MLHGSSSPLRFAVPVFSALLTLALPAAPRPRPAAPVVTVSPSPYATINQDIRASVPPDHGSSFTWTVAAGSAQIVDGDDHSVRVHATGLGPLTLLCTATNAAGSASGTGGTVVVAAPVAEITAPAYLQLQGSGTASVPAQPGCSYQWTVRGAVAAGAGNAPTFAFTAQGDGDHDRDDKTIQLACQVTNQAGTAAGDHAVIHLLALPAATVSAPAHVSPGVTYRASAPDQRGASFVWQVSGASFTAAPGDPDDISFVPQAYVPGGPNLVTLTCTVSNALGIPVTSTATAIIDGPAVQPPVISALYFSNASLAVGAPATLQWIVSNATSLSLDNGIGAVTGTSCSFTPPTAPGNYVYTLTATNAVGTSVTRTAALAVTPDESIVSFAANVAQVPRNGMASLTAVFAGGTGVVNPGGMAIRSGAPLPVGPIAASTTYVLTVTDPYGNAVQSSPVTIGMVPGLFATGANLVSSRSRHTVTPLPDGTVLLAGGVDASGNALATAEIQDPVHGAPPVTLYLATARQGHSATLLGDGSVLLAGGTDASGNPVGSAEVLDPATPSAIPPILGMAPRTGHTATLLRNGLVLVAGGRNAGGTLNTFELLDPAQAVAGPTPAANPPQATTLIAARSGHVAIRLADGTVLLAGGQDGSGNDLASAEIFNPATGTFTATGAMTAGRSFAAALTLPDGRVLVLGGSSGANAVATVEAYAGGAFSPLGALASARVLPTATLLPNGQILVAGGAGLTSGESFNPASGTSTALASSLGTSRTGMDALLLRSGLVWFAGESAVTEQFDPQDPTLLVPALPDVTLNGVPPLAMAGVSATATAVLANPASGERYDWTLHNATAAFGQGTAQLGYGYDPDPTASSNNVQVDVVVTSALGLPAHASGTTTIVDPPLVQVLDGQGNPVGPEVTAGTPLTATVTNPQSVLIYTWTLADGSPASGTGSSFSFTAGTDPASPLALTFSAADAQATISASGQFIRAIVAAPALPVISLGLAQPGYVTQGLSYAASVVDQPGSSFSWSIAGGTLGSTSGTAVSFTVDPNAASVALQCTVTNPANSVMTYIAPPLTAVPEPSLAGLAFAPATIQANGTSSLTGSVLNAAQVSVDQGIGSISGLPVTVGPEATPGTLTFDVTATNLAGTSVTGAASLNVIPLPAITSFQASASSVAPGAAVTLTPVFTGGTATVTGVAGMVSSGAGITAMPMAPSTSYTLTVSNGISSVSSTIRVSVLAATAPPVITGFAATPNNSDPGGSLLTATISDSTGSLSLQGTVNPGGLTLTSGVPVPVHPAVATLYTLTATNTAGSTQATAVVGPVNPFTLPGINLKVARHHHTCTVLPNGLVLFTGGGPLDLSGPASATTEFYNPVTGALASGPALSTARAGHVATLAPNWYYDFGQLGTMQNSNIPFVIITGGTPDTTAIDALSSATPDDPSSYFNGSSYTYLPSAGDYAMPFLDYPRHGHVAVATGQNDNTSLLPYVVIAGGRGDQGNPEPWEILSPNTDAIPEVFDSTAFGFTPLPASDGFTANLLSNQSQILYTGGRDATTGLASAKAELQDFYLNFSPVPISPMLTARVGHTATVLADGRVLITGNTPSAAHDTAELWNPGSYTDPVTGNIVTPATPTGFVATGAMAATRANAFGILLKNGKVLIAGGDLPSDPACTMAELYDPASGTFALLPPMPLGVSSTDGTACLLNNGNVLFTVPGTGPTRMMIFTPPQ